MGLPGNALVVEITESLLLDQAEGVAERLLSLVDAGIKISLDDFDTEVARLTTVTLTDGVVDGDRIDAPSDQRPQGRHSGDTQAVHQDSLAHGRRLPA